MAMPKIRTLTALGAPGLRRNLSRLCLYIGTVSCSVLVACSAEEAISPGKLGQLMFLDQSKVLSFDKTDTPKGEYGNVDLAKDGSITVSLGYLKGWAYKGRVAPHSGNEIATGVDGTYSYCIDALNRALDGDERLNHVVIPYIDHFMASLLHPDSPTLSRENLSEITTLLQNAMSKKNGAVAGEWLNGPTTYYVYGKWLWKLEAFDNVASVCAYPLI